jgi:hypothetical protein
MTVARKPVAGESTKEAVKTIARGMPGDFGEAYEARRPNGALRFRCKGCKKDFTITSGALFASHKLPLRGYLAAIAVFCNRSEG